MEKADVLAAPAVPVKIEPVAVVFDCVTVEREPNRYEWGRGEFSCTQALAVGAKLYPESAIQALLAREQLLLGCLHQINSAAVMLPTFEVEAEGEEEVATENIVAAIREAVPRMIDGPDATSLAEALRQERQACEIHEQKTHVVRRIMKPILEAAGAPGIDKGAFLSLDDVGRGPKVVEITFGGHMRGSDWTDTICLPWGVVYAPDPVAAARDWHASRLERAQAENLELKRSMVERLHREIRDAEKGGAA